MKRQTKFTSQEQERLATGQQAQQQAAHEFANVEEMLRHDALHTPVPPAIARRLEESIHQIAPPASPWWRRLFNGRKP